GGNRPLLILGLPYEQNFSGKPEKLEFQRNLINGGLKLGGEYEVSFAFYNSKKNRVLSTIATVPQILEIGNERTLAINGCQNFKAQEPKDSGAPLERFRFGR